MPGKDGGGQDFFSETQWPKSFEDRSQPGQRRRHLIMRLITGCQPVSHTSNSLAEKGKGWLGLVQAARPAAKSGGIGQAIRVFELRQCLFPATVLHQAPQQCLAARQQAVMGVRERKHWEKCEGRSALDAAAPTNPDPVVIFVMRLLAAASVTDDRIAFTNGAMA